MIGRDILQALPKTDLHVHLDGSIRLASLIDLAKAQRVTLPAYTVEGLHELVFKERYENLVEYLSGFGYITAVMQDPDSLERLAYEFAVDNFAEGVRYFEVRFAPQLHVNRRMDTAEVLESVDRGLERAKNEWNQREAIQNGAEPPFDYGIIVCALRQWERGSSDYFRMLSDVHEHTPSRQIFALASLELARATVHIRDAKGLPITGFDLAGAEAGYPAVDHKAAYDYVHKHFLKKTVHAGEAYGPESIFQAITDLHADRIGHGYSLLSPEAIQDPSIQDRRRYVDALSQYVADRRITVEVCLTSNLQTNPHLHADPARHTFAHMLDRRLSTTLCTDNRTISSTSVTQELELAIRHFDVTRNQLRGLIVYGFKRSFYPGSYAEKRHYVRQIIDYYERLERQFGLDQIEKDLPLRMV